MANFKTNETLPNKKPISWPQTARARDPSHGDREAAHREVGNPDLLLGGLGDLLLGLQRTPDGAVLLRHEIERHVLLGLALLAGLRLQLLVVHGQDARATLIFATTLIFASLEAAPPVTFATRS